MFAKAAMLVGLYMVAMFAGCVGSEGSTPQGSQPTSAPVQAAPGEFDEASGAIEGLVHDDNIIPIEGAQVGLLGTEIPPAISSLEGTFSFSRIAPGTYTVVAQKLGYESVAKKIDVVAGSVTNVDLTIVAISVEEAYSEILHQRGLFGCGLSWRPAVVYSGVAACGVVEGTQFDDFLLIFELKGKPSEWQGAVYEMQWRSSQAFGKGLSVNFEVAGCSNSGPSTFQRIRGASPLRAWQPTEMVEEKLENNTKSTCSARTNCTEDKCRIQSRVFSHPDTLGTSAPADVGITIQQQFEQFLSIFYNGPAPETHTALADS